MKRYINIIFFLLLVNFVFGQSVVNSPHDLSFNSPGDYKSFSQDEVCIFCHTPHATEPEGPLWNRETSGKEYILYNSPSFKAISDQPDGSSILCLSCHDGTIALGNIKNSSKGIAFNTQYIKGSSNLTKDLSDDHPISFVYDVGLVKTDGKLIIPDNKLVDNNKKMQCTSCHDPHDNSNNDFLREPNNNGALCKRCHDVDGNWATSVHMNSGVNIPEATPWLNQPYKTISENACSNCHRSHDAESTPLMNAFEENNCLNCHNGSVPGAVNISADLLKKSKHNVIGYSQVHKNNEAVMPSATHIECIDCHNPHEMTKSSSSTIAPFVKGANIHVPGITIGGASVSSINYEYELCFRCHSQNAVTSSPTLRLINSNNTRLEFATTNISFHPVAGPRNNSEVSSLLTPMNQNSQIYCSSCHAGNGSGSAAGPHGSSFQFILKNYYNRSKALIGSPKTITASFLNTQYALCAECHNMTQIITSHNNMNKSHFLAYTSCNTCHDPHGFEGGSVQNNKFLINYDTEVIKTGINESAAFSMTGGQHGTCNFICHDVTGNTVFKDFKHNNLRY